MKLFRPQSLLAALLVAASVAGCAGSRSASVAPDVPHGLTPKDVATASSSPSSSPQSAAPGTYVHSSGAPAYSTALTSAPIYQDAQTGITSQTDPSGTYTNFYDTNGTFTHQVDIGGVSPAGTPIVRDSEANGTVASMAMPDLTAQPSTGSFTVGDFSYTLDGAGTASASLAGKSVTINVEVGEQSGTLTDPSGNSFALNFAPSAANAASLSARLRAAAQHAAPQSAGKRPSATDACNAARLLMALAAAALVLVIAGAAMICAGAANPMQLYYCYRALATVAGFVAALAVAISNWRKACATPTPSPTPLVTPTPRPTATPVSTSTPAPTPSGSGTATPSGTPTPTPSGSATPSVQPSALPTASGMAAPMFAPA